MLLDRLGTSAMRTSPPTLPHAERVGGSTRLRARGIAPLPPCPYFGTATACRALSGSALRRRLEFLHHDPAEVDARIAAADADAVDG